MRNEKVILKWNTHIVVLIMRMFLFSNGIRIYRKNLLRAPHAKLKQQCIVYARIDIFIDFLLSFFIFEKIILYLIHVENESK